MGTHYMMSPDHSAEFVISELALVLIGTGPALVMNWKMPGNRKGIYEDMEKIEDDMQQILRELAYHLQRGLERARGISYGFPCRNCFSLIIQIKCVILKGIGTGHSKAGASFCVCFL